MLMQLFSRVILLLQIAPDCRPIYGQAVSNIYFAQMATAIAERIVRPSVCLLTGVSKVVTAAGHSDELAGLQYKCPCYTVVP